MKNVLENSRAYLAGPIDYVEDDGVPWRRDMTRFLNALGILVIDPTDKPVINDYISNEIGKEKDNVHELRENGDFEELRRKVKKIRNVDLRLTDLADFLIIYLDLDITMCGTWEELFNANRQKKPLFIVAKGGPRGVPNWLHGVIPSSYMFGSFTELKYYLERLNTGLEDLDDRWLLLDHEKLSRGLMRSV